ncbi:accessory Sec system glycosyltransferase Asp1 [Lactococcus cremoris]|uniref:accessory Sec system glycosyltransferase Asp1 n=1 Tax=Lactococcus lactis subsp. cremoris TaxID=1359 RepID=UPI002871518F|nr:accessory Sec system glycosyltransferase Asp1 [Lactococcus cremoris]MDR9868267.1 accessory Sec system glycosyltransferase Asp1 [Lactococcus cremoris]
MNYFVNENIFTLNSGTEFSAIKRLKLFHSQGISAKILTRNYNSQLAGDLKRIDLNHNDILNMYDYFQDITDVEVRDMNVRYSSVIDKKTYHIEGIDANKSLIKHAGHIIGEVTIAPSTMGAIGSIDYYNDMGEVVVKDIWDRRGFKSSTQYFHPGEELGSQIFYDNNGKVKIEITHMNVNGVLQPTMYKLLDYKNKIYRFNSEQELFVFFMDELALKNESIFINDRISLVNAVSEVRNSKGKWQFLHSVYSKIFNPLGNEDVGSVYLKELFRTLENKFDGVIVPTEEEAFDIKKTWELKNVIALPDTHAEQILKNDNIRRQKNKIIYVGRISEEKNPAEIIEILKIVQQKIPNVIFEFYGYASSNNLQNNLQQLVEKYNLHKNVYFKGYQVNEELHQALQEASLFLNVSKNESFGMNILEAMTYGVPVISYRVKYGVQKLIDTNINGSLVSFGSRKEAAKTIIDILENQELQKKLSSAAEKKAIEFNADKVWEKWTNNNISLNNLFTP